MEMWFKEPEIPDDTYANRGEEIFDWLVRSTVRRAVEARRFLNDNLAALPEAAQKQVFEALRYRWRTAFFELIVVRTLQELGALIEPEAENVDGRRPDFVATFLDGAITVEATVPSICPEVDKEFKSRVPLLEIIEANIPDGWDLGVWELPVIGLSDSRKEFKRAVERMLDVPPPDDGSDDVEVRQTISTGAIHLHLWPKGARTRSLLLEPPITAFDNSEARIRNAVGAKRSQVRKSGRPVLLAIEASGISSDYGDFDRALYGRTYEAVDGRGQVVDRGFVEDGVFNNNRSGPPTYAGVIAFIEVGFRCRGRPRLYHHPRSLTKLPSALSALDQCIYDPRGQYIKLASANGTSYLERLGFVGEDV